MELGLAVAYVALSLLLCAFALAVRYAITQQHVWHAEHRITVR